MPERTRPTEYCPDKMRAMLKRFAGGESFSAICAGDDNLPDITDCYIWLQQFINESPNEWKAAREGHALSAALGILDAAKIRDNSRAKNEIQARQWLASRLSPTQFGEKVNIEVEHKVSLAAALEEARARYLKSGECDQPQIVDASYTEITKA